LAYFRHPLPPCVIWWHLLRPPPRPPTVWQDNFHFTENIAFYRLLLWNLAQKWTKNDSLHFGWPPSPLWHLVTQAPLVFFKSIQNGQNFCNSVKKKWENFHLVQLLHRLLHQSRLLHLCVEGVLQVVRLLRNWNGTLTDLITNPLVKNIVRWNLIIEKQCEYFFGTL